MAAQDSAAMNARVSVQGEDFDVGAEHRELCAEAPGAGAVVTFSGLVRDFYDPGGGRVEELRLEHYPGMTEKSISAIIGRAWRRWPLLAVRVIHRVGALAPGDRIVFAGVASHHRHEAFAAAGFIMDYLKSEAPLWKKQITDSGGEWITTRDNDTEALRDWEGQRRR